jgi:hypothetical protein
MSAVLHLLRKDLRHLWALALAGIVFSLVSTLGWYWDLLPRSSGFLAFVTSQIAPMVILFIASVAVVQSDPAVGDRAFWRTRPIPPGVLLAAKALFLVLVFGLPSLLVNLYLAVSMETPSPVLLAMVVESTGMILAECLVAALAATVTTSLMQAAALMLAAAIAVLAVGALVPLPNLFAPWRLDLPDHAPRMAAVGLFGGFAALILIAHQYLTRRTVRTFVLLAVFIPAVLFSSGRWPVSFRFASLDSSDTVVTPEKSTGVQMMLIPPTITWGYGSVNDPATGRAVRAHTVAMNAAMRSVPEGRIIQVESIASTIRYPDGEELPFGSTGKVYWPFYSGLAQAQAICRELGLVPPAPYPDDSRRPVLRLFSVSNEKAKALSGKRGTLTATLKLYELAFHDVASIPARPGARLVRDGQMWKIRNIEVLKGSIVVALQHLRATSVLITQGPARPDFRSDGYRFGFVLLNRKRGEFSLSNFRWPSEDTPQWTVDINNHNISFGQPWKVGGPPIDTPLDESWISDAEMVIMSAVPVGTFEKQLTLENFEIPQAPDTPDSVPASYWQ